MTEEERAAIYARAEREGWDQFTLGMVLIGALDLDEIAERARVREGGEALHGLPVGQWPPIDIRWDLSVEARPFAADGKQAADGIRSMARADLVLLCVPLAELQAALTARAKRAPDEIWEIGAPDKAARAPFWWSEGRRMTPPLYAVWQGKEVTITGGNHRVAVADAKGARHIPAYVAQKDLADFLRLVPGATQIPDACIDDPDAWDKAC
ncbi:MAG: hypothetical protein DI601_06405 [Azospirillum brasilense]|nr:MAG: hypothetical protein DI601_06405 [Azospirillum brasilense]PZR08552.1 MAG: hypothetical protein DI532_21600 [Azospirillum brasilense]